MSEMAVKLAYASETGTALSLVKQLTYYFNFSQVTSFSGVDDMSGTWIFIIATTGSGDPPKSMQTFYSKMLKKNYPALPLLTFSVYGLGDISYGQNYNLAARKFRQRLLTLGATELVPIGLGNFQDKKSYRHCFEDVWLPALKSKLGNYRLKDKDQIVCSARLYQNKPDCQKLQVRACRVLSTLAQRKTYEILLQSSAKFKEGNVLCVYPMNRQVNVQFLLQYFSLAPEQGLSVGKREYQAGDLFANQLNLSSQVPHCFFIKHPQLKDLSCYAPEEMHKLKLDELAVSFDEYDNYIRQYKRNVIEVIKDFTLTIPFPDFVERINWVFPRKYSIARIDADRSEIGLLVRLVEETKGHRLHEGLCSSFFLRQGQEPLKVQAYVQEGAFNIETYKNIRFLVIALGTGVAPFLPIMRNIVKEESCSGIVYFSNRFSSENYLDLVPESKNLDLRPTFTQEGGKRIPKKLEEEGEEIRNFLWNKGGQNFRILICGPVTFYEHVTNILERECLEGTSLKELKKKKQLLYESW